MTATIRYTDGRPEQEYSSIQFAAKALLKEFPEGVIYDSAAEQRDDDDADEVYEIRGGRAALAWECEADSTNDDGSNAVASINVEAAQ